MPDGFQQTDEACLDKAASLLPQRERHALRDWWLAIPSRRSRTPTFDIASTCTVDGYSGLILVEAKAHTEELNTESAGKELRLPATPNSLQNHRHIGERISEANSSFAKSTGLAWRLSRDRCYQMSNRFAWSWKLTELGYPVVLVYLGFLNAKEMKDRGDSFGNHSEWEALVKEHSRSIVPKGVWEKPLAVYRAPFIPCIRSREMSYDTPLKEV